MPLTNEPNNVRGLMVEQLPGDILALFKEAGAFAGQLGKRVYLTGGTVRDLFLHRSNLDIDLIVEGNAIELAGQLISGKDAGITVHRRFGTVKVRREGLTFDLAMARSETYPKPGALPVVRPGTIYEDLYRRDFTINAMAVSLNNDDFGNLTDPHHGVADIEKKIIRILHEKSFIDDSTRMFRAIRYRQRLGFLLEERTAWLLLRDAAMVNTVSGDRQRHELEFILKEECPEEILMEAQRFGLLKQVFPGLKFDSWLKDKFQSVRAGINIKSPLSTYFALLTFKLDAGQCQELIQKLKIPRTAARIMLDLHSLKAKEGILKSSALKPGEIFRILTGYQPEAVRIMCNITGSPELRRHLQLYLEKLRYVKTFIDGEALKQLNVPPGPEMGRLLERLLLAKLDGQVKSKEDEIKLVKKWIEQEQGG